jgi:hypothetical protein
MKFQVIFDIELTEEKINSIYNKGSADLYMEVLRDKSSLTREEMIKVLLNDAILRGDSVQTIIELPNKMQWIVK